MRLLSAFIFDQRYSVPTLLVAEPVAPGEEERHAEQLMKKSDAYYAVELRDGDELVTRVERERAHNARSWGRSSGLGA